MVKYRELACYPNTANSKTFLCILATWYGTAHEMKNKQTHSPAPKQCGVGELTKMFMTRLYSCHITMLYGPPHHPMFLSLSTDAQALFMDWLHPVKVAVNASVNRKTTWQAIQCNVVSWVITSGSNNHVTIK